MLKDHDEDYLSNHSYLELYAILKLRACFAAIHVCCICYHEVKKARAFGRNVVICCSLFALLSLFLSCSTKELKTIDVVMVDSQPLSLKNFNFTKLIHSMCT